MIDDSFTARSRNVRRGARGTLIFRISTVISVLCLSLVLIKLSGELKQARGEVKSLTAELEGLPELGAATSEPVEQRDYSPEITQLNASLAGLRTELSEAIEKANQNLATSERAAAEERLKLVADIGALERRLAEGGNVGSPPIPNPNGGEITREPPVPVVVDDGSSEPVGNGGDEEGDGTVEGTVEMVEDDPPPPPIDMTEEQATADGSDEGAPSDYREYTIRRGDTISQIARKHQVDMAALLELNSISNPSRIQIGQVLKIPNP